MGRSLAFTPDDVAHALTKAKGLKSRTARALGTDYATVERYIDRFPACREAWLNARETIGDDLEEAAVELALAGDGPTLRFLLGTVYKERGYIQTQDHRSLKIDVSKLSTEQLRDLVAGKPIIEVIADTSVAREDEDDILVIDSTSSSTSGT